MQDTTPHLLLAEQVPGATVPDMEESASNVLPEIDLENCLFCNTSSTDFDSSLKHMQQWHGLFIPDQRRLIVDVETLVRYLHLVIFEFHSCLYCNTRRTSAEAVQQHMRGTGHCKIDVTGDSEYREFYEDSSEEGEESDEEEGGEHGSESGGITGRTPTKQDLDKDTIHLPSGAIVSSRFASTKAPAGRSTARRHSDTKQPEQLPFTNPSSPDFTIAAPTKRQEKRAAIADMRINTQLRQADRAAVQHLSLPERRAVIATQMRQMDKARKQQQKQHSHVERLGNKTLMKHYRPDAPGARPNG